MPFTITVQHELGTSFFTFLDRLKDLSMPAFDELVSKIDDIATMLETVKTDLSAVVVAETGQVAAAIAALEAQLGNVLTPAEFSAVGARLEALKSAANFDGVKAAIESIINPAAPETPAE